MSIPSINNNTNLNNLSNADSNVAIAGNINAAAALNAITPNDVSSSINYGNGGYDGMYLPGQPVYQDPANIVYDDNYYTQPMPAYHHPVDLMPPYYGGPVIVEPMPVVPVYPIPNYPIVTAPPALTDSSYMASLINSLYNQIFAQLSALLADILGGMNNSGANTVNANDDFATTTTGNAVSINVLADDTDPNGDTFSINAITDQPRNGAVAINSNGIITYTPNAGFTGMDQFEYEIIDASGARDRATVDIVVSNTAIANTVTALDDAASTTENTPITINVLANDSDPNGDTFSVNGITAQPSNGTVAINSDGTITYTPNAGYTSGNDSFTYQIIDSQGNTDTARVSITVSPAAPNNTVTALDDTASTIENTPITINVLANDSDPNGDTFSINGITAQPSNGTVAINSDGTITYTPNAGYTSGNDSFTYQIIDSQGNTDTARVSITVSPANPSNTVTANDDSAVTNENTPVVINVLNDDVDSEGHAFSITGITAQPNNGTVAINSNGTITYTPNNGYSGADQFTYQITDSLGATDVADVEIGIIASNNTVIANGDSTTTAFNTPVTISVLNNDSDPNGDTFSINGITSQPSNGTVAVNNNGTITYTPNNGYSGADQFSYRIIDSQGNTDTAVVTLTINPNTNSVIANNDPAVNTNADSAVNINVLANDTDPDGDTFSVNGITAQPSNGTVAVNNDGTITYTPNAGFTGMDQFTYRIIDSQGNTDTATVMLHVNPDGFVCSEDLHAFKTDENNQLWRLENNANGDLEATLLGDLTYNGSTHFMDSIGFNSIDFKLYGYETIDGTTGLWEIAYDGTLQPVTIPGLPTNFNSSASAIDANGIMYIREKVGDLNRLHKVDLTNRTYEGFVDMTGGDNGFGFDFALNPVNNNEIVTVNASNLFVYDATTGALIRRISPISRNLGASGSQWFDEDGNFFAWANDAVGNPNHAPIGVYRIDTVTGDVVEVNSTLAAQGLPGLGDAGGVLC